MSGSVTLCWRCGENTWAGRPCEHCGAPEEPPEYPETPPVPVYDDPLYCQVHKAKRTSECCGAELVPDTDICRCCREHAAVECPECGQERPDDDRVLAGMKCGPCAYGF